MPTLVHYSVEGSVARLTLDSPDNRNALSTALVNQLHQGLTDAAEEAGVRAVVLDHTGGTFCAGADLTQAASGGPAVDPGHLAVDRARELTQLLRRILKLPMPVIAAVDGHALGAGAELAYAADFRIGTPSVRIGNPETGLGILAAAGASWRLKELVGEPVAKEMLLAGSVLRAERALAVNLITEIHEPSDLMAAAHSLADRIATQDPLAVRITKSVFHAPAEAHPLIDQLAQGILFESQAKFDRMQTFLDKKSAKKSEKKSAKEPGKQK